MDAYSRVDAYNFDNKFQGGRLFQRGRLLDREEYFLAAKGHRNHLVIILVTWHGCIVTSSILLRSSLLKCVTFLYLGFVFTLHFSLFQFLEHTGPRKKRSSTIGAIIGYLWKCR